MKYTSSYEENSDKKNARNLFFRAYNIEGINFNNTGEGIVAIFMGNDMTINAKIVYKWVVVSPITVERKRLTDDIKKYIQEV
ncbi:MAG: hypothetical protein BWY36_00906 [Candidatus Diapherotrites archaeon ADurb.Bin253]|nr:MAG: hypothetical protein BWY36_00906 [Candidatus Diapherotrites archaeon ADurb.Bin253]